jgi:hypothetical protein
VPQRQEIASIARNFRFNQHRIDPDGDRGGGLF